MMIANSSASEPGREGNPHEEEWRPAARIRSTPCLPWRDRTLSLTVLKPSRSSMRTANRCVSLAPRRYSSSFSAKKRRLGRPVKGIVACQSRAPQVPRMMPCLDFMGDVLIATKPIDHPGDAKHEDHENNVVDLPILIFHPELEYVARNVINIRKNKCGHSDAKKHNGIALIASHPFNRSDFKKGIGWSTGRHDIRPIKGRASLFRLSVREVNKHTRI